MNQQSVSKLVTLLQQSRSFSSDDKKQMIAKVPSLDDKQQQELIAILSKEQTDRQQNRETFIQEIEAINEKYGASLDPLEELHKMDARLQQQIEYEATVRDVAKQEEKKNDEDLQEAEQILHNL